MREFPPTPGWRQAAVFIRLLAEGLGRAGAWRELIEKIGKRKRRCIIINDGKGVLGAKDGALSACPCASAEVDFTFLGEDE